MDPPSYYEANLHPPVVNTVSLSITSPPTYYASLALPPTSPPSYGEAVTLATDPYPVLAPPAMMSRVTSQPPHTSYIVHQTAHTNMVQRVQRVERVERPPQQTVVVVQPQTVLALGSCPASIRCPYCQQSVVTEIKFIPGCAAWCTCVLLLLTGLVCGCCLIPFLCHELHDVHHTCPVCHNHLHIYKR